MSEQAESFQGDLTSLGLSDAPLEKGVGEGIHKALIANFSFQQKKTEDGVDRNFVITYKITEGKYAGESIQDWKIMHGKGRLTDSQAKTAINVVLQNIGFSEQDILENRINNEALKTKLGTPVRIEVKKKGVYKNVVDVRLDTDSQFLTPTSVGNLNTVVNGQPSQPTVGSPIPPSSVMDQL